MGTVARLDPIKNHEMMIRSLKAVQALHPDTYLIIVGDGPERQRLQCLASDFQLGRHVIITGYREDTEAFYKIMDLFLLTSFSEGMAMTLLEAMACGLPCVATDVGGNAEVVCGGLTGLIIPSGDEAKLGQAICRLLGDKEMRQRMGSEGQKRFSEKFTASRMAQEYEALYDKMLSGVHPPRKRIY